MRERNKGAKTFDVSHGEKSQKSRGLLGYETYVETEIEKESGHRREALKDRRNVLSHV